MDNKGTTFMSTIELRQFKLTNQEEIVTEVLDFGDETEDGALVVRNTMKLVDAERSGPGMTGIRYYAFRPFMLYQGDGQHVQIINPGHVVSECTPTKQLIEQYQNAIEEMIMNGNKDLTGLEDTKKAMQAYHETMAKLMKDRITEDTALYADDSTPKVANVIKFRSKKDTFH